MQCICVYVCVCECVPWMQACLRIADLWGDPLEDSLFLYSGSVRLEETQAVFGMKEKAKGKRKRGEKEKEKTETERKRQKDMCWSWSILCPNTSMTRSRFNWTDLKTQSVFFAADPITSLPMPASVKWKFDDAKRKCECERERDKSTTGTKYKLEQIKVVFVPSP